jgi:hypothetical protein
MTLCDEKEREVRQLQGRAQQQFPWNQESFHPTWETTQVKKELGKWVKIECSRRFQTEEELVQRSYG